MKLSQDAIDVLNVLIWKMGRPFGCRTADEIAAFIIAELEDKGMTGVEWDQTNDQFFRSGARPLNR